MLLFLLACAEPLPLPTKAAAVVEHDRSLDPPLYRALYDYAFLPEVQTQEQRVRLRVWLHYMAFNRLQLGLLQELVARVDLERAEVEARQAAILAEHEPQVGAVYDRIWEALEQDASEAELAALAKELTEVREREQDLLSLRAQSVRALFEAEAPFLRTLTPAQEIRFTDATFLLRHRLDPYANPGDFNSLVGPVYVAGQFGALSKPTFDPNEDHLNIGGLWSPEPELLTGPQYPNARREIILYMVLLEPGLTEALGAELMRRPTVESTPAGVLPGEGGPTAPVPGGVMPGVPAAPMPGIPSAPAPVELKPGLPAAPVAPGKPVEPAPGKPSEPPPAR